MANRQATEFCQYLLPEEAFLAPEATWNLLRGPKATEWLAEQWAKAHQYANTPEPPVPATGLLAEQCPVGPREGILISLPPADLPPEAWFALLVRTPDGEAPFRYFLLEPAPDAGVADNAAQAPPAPTSTLICERQPDAGAHHVRGPGPLASTPVTAAAFIIGVARLLAEPAESA